MGSRPTCARPSGPPAKFQAAETQYRGLSGIPGTLPGRRASRSASPLGRRSLLAYHPRWLLGRLKPFCQAVPASPHSPSFYRGKSRAFAFIQKLRVRGLTDNVLIRLNTRGKNGNSHSPMTAILSPELKRALANRIRYYQELGIFDFYRREASSPPAMVAGATFREETFVHNSEST